MKKIGAQSKFVFSSARWRYQRSWRLTIALVATAACMTLAACSPSVSDLQTEVKKSMATNLAKDANLSQYHLQVQTISLIRATGNEYQGMADVAYKGQVHQVPIHVVADGSQMMWRVDPGAFAFIAQDEFNDAAHQLQESVNQLRAPSEGVPDVAPTEPSSSASYPPDQVSSPNPTQASTPTLASSGAAAALAPSFDCSKATHIDSLTICENPELSALDRQWTETYLLYKQTAEPIALKRWRDNFLQERRACGGDVQCIAAAYHQVLHSTP